jgi:chaperonin GroEL
MLFKQLLFRSAARAKVLRGATQLADAIRITTGPKSKPVLIQKQWGGPIICNDDVVLIPGIPLSDGDSHGQY